MILLKPWHDAFHVEMVTTRQKEHLVLELVVIATNGTRFRYTLLGGQPDRELLHIFIFNSVLILDALILLFVQYSLEGFNVHAVDRTFTLGQVLFSINYVFVLILVIKPVQIILSVFGTFNRHVFFANLPHTDVWFDVLIFEWLLSVWIIIILVFIIKSRLLPSCKGILIYLV